MLPAPVPGLKVGRAMLTDYRADAVHFDGSTSLRIGSLAAPLAPTSFSCSLWFRSSPFNSPPNYHTFFVTDPDNAYSTFSGVWNSVSQNPGNSFVSMFDSNGSNNDGAYSSVRVDNGEWHNMIFSGTTGDSQNIFAIYIDDQPATGVTSDSAAYTMAFNGLPFRVGDDGFGGGFIGDMADLWIAPGVQLVENDGNFNGIISEANRRLFISADGKPVRPTNFPTGTMLFSGNKDIFSINQSTGGVFSVTGTLTNASTSPSD